uniref:Uncharacterized protein n=1 Tax=Octactis speculum TaxID=3111310 RepID=A0A7S2E499_9STRA|mmetsp:Transcript_58082/g.79156  ORF Transcript_58082/g.79156 Transcript_58082/m.79156 type:complete len:141 (+) Transcript_58082:196-618(+)
MLLVNMLGQYVYPWRYQTRTKVKGRDGFIRRDFYLDNNFGELDFDWVSGELTARVLSGRDGRVVLERSWRLTDLDMPPGGSSEVDADWVCVPHRGEATWLERWGGKFVVVVFALMLLLSKPAAALALFLLFMRKVKKLIG